MAEQFYRYDDPSGKTRNIKITHEDVNGNVTTENRKIKDTTLFSSSDLDIAANVALGRPIYKTKDGLYTANEFLTAPSVTIDKKTGDIRVNAPESVMKEDWFKEQFSDNKQLKQLSQMYKMNPDYSVETTDENGKTVYKKVDELVNEYDKGLKKAVEDLQKLHSERDRVLLPVYGNKVDKMSTNDLVTALTPTYNVGDFKVSGSAVISIPDFMLNHPVWGPMIKKLTSFDEKNGTVVRDDFMKNLWNRNKNPELTAERIQELYQNLGTSLAYSGWDNVVEDDYERHGSNQAAREIAFRNFIAGQDPEADFLLKAGDVITSAIGGIGMGIIDTTLGIANGLETVNNFLTPGDDLDSSKVKEAVEAWDDWKRYNTEQLQLISDASATITGVSELVTNLAANIYLGNTAARIVGGAATGVLGTVVNKAQLSQSSPLGQMIVGFAAALEGTKEAGSAIKSAIGAQKVFSTGGVLAGSAVDIMTQAVVDAALTDSVLFRRAIDGDGGEEAYNYLNEQFAWNVGGFAVGIGIGKLAMEGANTKVGRAINAKWAQNNAKLKTIGYNISDGIKAKIARRSLEDVVAQQDDIAKAATKTEKEMYKIQSVRTAEQLDTLKAETKAFAKADIDIFDGLKINEDGLAEAEKYITNIKALQNAIDMENRSLRIFVEGYDDIKINPEMAGLNKAMYNDVMEMNKYQKEMVTRTGKAFTRMQGSAFTQEAANYIGASIEVKYMEAVIASPENFAEGTVKSAMKNIDSYRDAIAAYTKEFSPELKAALDVYIEDGKKWYASMNRYRASKGLSNAQDLEDLLQSKMFENGDYMRVQRKIDHRYTETILEDGTKHTNINIEFQHLEFDVMSDFMAPDTVQSLYKINTANAERNLGVLKTRLSVKSAMKDTIVSGEDTQLAKDFRAKADFNKAADEYAKKFTADNTLFDASSIKSKYSDVVARAKKEEKLTSDIKKTEAGIEKAATKTYSVNDADRIMAANTLAPTDVKDMLTTSGKSQTGSILQDGLDQFADDPDGFAEWLDNLPDESKKTINRVKRDYNQYVGGMTESPSAESLRLRDEIADSRREIEYALGDETTRAWDDYEMWAKNADADGMGGEYKQLTDEQTELARGNLERRMKAIGYDGEISPAGRADFDAWAQQQRAAYEDAFNQRVQRLRELRGEPKRIEFTDAQTAKGINRKNLPEPSGKKVTEKTRKKLMEDAFGTVDGDGLANAWFDGGDVTAKKEIATKLSTDENLRDAALYEMYELSGSKTPFNEWLDTPIEIRRVQSVDNLRNDDAFVSFSMDESWNGPKNTEGVEGDLVTLTIKPKDTYGSIYLGEFGGEKEVLVPRDVYRKAAGDLAVNESVSGSPRLRGMTRENIETLIGVDPNLEDTINLQVLRNDKDLLKSERITQMAEENKRIDDNFIRRNVLETQRNELIKIVGERGADEFVDDIVEFADKSIDNYITAMKTDPKTQKFARTIANATGDNEDDVFRYLALTSLERNQGEINKQIKAAFGSADKEMVHIGKQVENAFDSMLTNYVDNIMMQMSDSKLVSGELFDRIKAINDQITSATKQASDPFSNIIAATDTQGRKVFMQVDPVIARLYKTNVGHLQKPTTAWDNFNKLLSKTFRLGTTGVNLSSTMRQWFRDSGNAFSMGGAFRKIQSCSDELIEDWGERIVKQLSEYDYKQLATRAEELGTDIKRLAVERELRMGEVIAGQTTEVTLYKESLTKVKKLQENIQGARKTVDDIMNGMRENYLRNRVYVNNLTQAMRNGKTLDEARIIAEFAMNNATTNFSRKLVHLQRMADSAPYLSAAINGTKSFWRMATLDPVGVVTRIMAGFVIPQMYLTASSLADENNRMVYENLPEYTKSENLVFVQNGMAITIPIPQELAVVVDPFRQFTEGLYDSNKNSFWELAANDILGAFPVDFTGFTAVDMDDLVADPTIFDRLQRGAARVFSQVAPIPIKSAYMLATGTDPYSGKKLRDSSWVVWNDEIGDYETMDYNQSSFTKLIAGCFGKDANTKIAEKVLSGIFGNTGMDVADTLVSTFQRFVLGDESADPFAGAESQIERIGSSLTGEDYSMLNSEWQRAISQLESERDAIMASKEMQDLQTKLGQDNDEDTRQKLLAKRKDLLADWQKRVASTTQRLAEQGGTLDRYKFGAVVQLLNMNSVNGWAPENKYLQNLASQNYYAGRNEAYRTMDAFGLNGANDYSIFGYIKYKDGQPTIVYNTPTSIVTAGNLLLSAKDVDKANIDAIIKKNDLYTQREEMYNQTNAIYNKGKLSKSDYNNIDAIKMAYNNRVLAALVPYLEKVSPEAITNNEQIMDVLENLIQVPSAYEKIGKRYVSSGGGKLNKQQGFVRSYIKAILNKDNM